MAWLCWSKLWKVDFGPSRGNTEMIICRHYKFFLSFTHIDGTGCWVRCNALGCQGCRQTHGSPYGSWGRTKKDRKDAVKAKSGKTFKWQYVVTGSGFVNRRRTTWFESETSSPNGSFQRLDISFHVSSSADYDFLSGLGWISARCKSSHDLLTAFSKARWGCPGVSRAWLVWQVKSRQNSFSPIADEGRLWSFACSIVACKLMSLPCL